MSDYTPNEEHLIAGYADSCAAEEVLTAPKFVAEARRGIARIKAEALREAADAVREEAPDEPWAGATFVGFADWMAERADQIEEEGLWPCDTYKATGVDA